jgi:hypothetical protein
MNIFRHSINRGAEKEIEKKDMQEKSTKGLFSPTKKNLKPLSQV